MYCVCVLGDSLRMHMSSIMRWRSGETASVVSSLMVVLLLVGRGTSPRRQHTKHNLSVKTPGSSPCLDAGSQPYRGSGLVPRPEEDARSSQHPTPRLNEFLRSNTSDSTDRDRPHPFSFQPPSSSAF